MVFLVNWSLFVKSTLFFLDTTNILHKEDNDRPQCELAINSNGQKKVTVITSQGIQKRYQKAVKGLKRKIEVNNEIWLLEEEETATCIKIIQNDSFSKKNPNKSEKNKSKSEKNPIKRNKKKKRK